MYSDAASHEARLRVAEVGEQLLSVTLTEMGIDTASKLSLPRGKEKIDVYAFRDHLPEWAGKAYFGGLLIFSPDHRGRSGSDQTAPAAYEPFFKHELIHVITTSLLHSGDLAEPPGVDVWFFEGLAEALSGGTAQGSIRGMDHFDYLTSKYGKLNPVSYRSDDQVDAGVDAYTEYHYPMRQLAVEYLLDNLGLARTPPDATALFVDMAFGSDFEAAFGAHMGIPLADYEDRFFELMSSYLPEQSRSWVFQPLSRLALTIITVAAAVAVSVTSIRRSSALALSRPAADGSPPGRWSRVGFGIWIAAVCAFSLGLYLVGVTAVGSSWALDDTDRVTGVTVMIGYLAASAFVITWALRLRQGLRWFAWLIPMAAIGAALGALWLMGTLL